MNDVLIMAGLALFLLGFGAGFVLGYLHRAAFEE